MNLPGASASIFDRNKFLAEDRILAFGKSSLLRLCAIIISTRILHESTSP